mmetsp:Transcript_10577/g.20378  ORF Transcript_10577/g.20378 Transcript_10577/m.20378 type:complete len:883 (+) Transcript_10577:129-2777(+)
MGGVCNGPTNRQFLDDTPESSIREEQKSVSRPSDRRLGVKKQMTAARQECQTAVIIDKPKGPKDKELIASALNKHIIFSSLQNDTREQLINSMLHYSVEPSAVIFEQGSNALNFYIVEKGKLDVLVNGSKVNEAKPGDCFGELALIQDSTRSATLRASVKSTMWVIDRNTFRQALESLQLQSMEANRNFLKSVPQLEMLNVEQVDAMLNTVTDLHYTAGQKIVKEGDPGDLLFIIKEGTVLVTFEGREIRHLGIGEFFGEQALLYNSVRTATVSAVDACTCLAIGRQILEQALGSHLEKTVYRNSMRIALDSSPVFSHLTQDQVNMVIGRVQISQYPMGTIAIPASTPKGYCLWMVLKGSLKTQNEDHTFHKLTCIGDVNFLRQDHGKYEQNIFATSNSVIAAIHKEELESITQGPISQVIANNQALKALRQIELLRSLSNEKFKELVSAITISSFEARQQIVLENSIPDAFFIVKSGTCEVIKNGVVIRTLCKLAYFGERSMLLRESRSATVVAQTNVECWVLSQENFFRIIDERMRNLLLKRIDLQDESVILDDLAIVKVLGSGMFGKVYLTAHKVKRCLYALKVVEKERVMRLDTWESLILERNILLMLDHMYIAKLVKTLKDSLRIYFVMEYVRGLDMFDVIRELGLLKDRDAKFYIACLVLVIEYLQERDIVYRDFKPENIMIDEEGYPKVIDFGTAKIVHGRTFTVVGTPHYMAPEVITGKGYNKLADLWSLGVILYEFLCGGVPFGEDEEDPYAIYDKVLTSRITYPAFATNKLKCKPFIEQLLNRNPVLRTGGSIENLKANVWFSDINWDTLLSKGERAPFVPKLSSLTADITQALNSSATLNSQIVREEARNPLEPISRSAKVKAPADWDHDF